MVRFHRIYMKQSRIIIKNGIVRLLTRGMKVGAASGVSKLAPSLALSDSDLYSVLFDILNRYFSKEDLKNLNNLGTGFDFYRKRDIIITLVTNILDEIKGVNDLGYVNDFIITDKIKFPLTSKVLYSLIDTDKKGKIIKVESLSNENRIELIKWWFNVIYLDLYCVLTVLSTITKIELERNGFEEEDILLDLKILSLEIRNNLDSYIKLGLKRGGITILQNTYTGYDSEYKHKEGIINELISVQLASCFRNILKMPTPVDFYKNQGVNSFSGVLYDIKSKNNSLAMGFISGLINQNIKLIRSILYPGYDEAIKKIIDGFVKREITSVKKGEFTYFLLDKKVLRTWFFPNVKEISLKELVKKSNEMTQEDRDIALDELYKFLKDLYNEQELLANEKEVLEKEKEKEKEEEFEFNKKIFEETEVESLGFNGLEDESLGLEDEKGTELSYESGKKYVRTYKQTFTPNRASITLVKNNYFIGHHTAADLSLLKDFETFKHYLDIVDNSMVTLKKPILIDGVNVIVRDTMLLAPAGSRGLNVIGNLYNLEKVKIGKWITRMDDFLRENYDLFKEYAMQDAKITLIHALYMEEFAFNLGTIGIPLTLSMLSAGYLRKEWSKMNYTGYQINPEYYLNDSKTQTPRGLFAIGDIGSRISYYIGNYKGGRNESFMYGIDDKFKWIDYDLVSAYTTGMSIMGNPNYSKAKFLTEEELKNISNEELINSYIIIKGSFKFKDSVKYPSIPCFMDETTTIYPLSGECTLTGSEYVLAKTQGCEIKVKEIFFIPFETVSVDKEEVIVNQPFFKVIKELQSKRSLYEKGSIKNFLYKLLGNAMYGLVVKGISNKKKFDVRLGRTIRMEGNDLSNPIIASWITAYIRSVIGELLHNISLLKGRVISVTTDGFLTDISKLEEEISNLPSSILLKSYKKARFNLTQSNDTALEIKKSGVGMISWTTRGQFSLDGNLIASTGFQRGLYEMTEIEELLRDGLSNSREITYINSRLRSALEVFKFGGHVTKEYKDQIFRLFYDNKRRILNDSSKNEMLDSYPVQDVKEAKLYRTLSKKPIVKKYQKQLNVKVYRNKYKNVLEITVRNFIRCLLTNSLNLDNSVFNSYSEIVEFITNYDKSIKISTNSIAQLKRRFIKPKKLYRDLISNAFVEYVKLKFPKFDAEKFFNELKENHDSEG